MKIILASASPRRKELLSKIINKFDIIPSKSEELIPQDTSPIDVPETLAFQKAVEVWKNNKDAVVIGADTVVIIDNEILGKPQNADDATNMLKKLSGKEHIVVTGVAIMSSQKSKSFSVATKVKFDPLTPDVIEKYIATGEPFDKAGAYGIQGYGSAFINGIIGDYFNVMGLPINMLRNNLIGFCKEDIII